MNKPNLFIVGASKSGTTTLYHYLEKHFQVFMPEDELYKEPAFFSIKGEKMGYKKYLDIFKNAKSSHKYIGEASTAYLTDDVAAKRIYDYNKDSKIIILLRNPVDRAYSLYNWMVQEGYEYSLNFEMALKKELSRKYKKIPNFFEPEYYWNYMYLESGLYYEQVKRYFELFNSEKIKVIIFEDMVKDIQKTYHEVSSFLEIEYQEINIEQENESKSVYLALLSFFGRKVTNLVNRYFKIEKKKTKDSLIYKLQKKVKPKKLNEETRGKLFMYYAEDIQKLEKLLGKDLSIWK